MATRRPETAGTGGGTAGDGGYLPFVDGLRATAILLVVLYHAGVAWLPGGFVGVDVFFVISGYLIISQIAHAMGERRFSHIEFWSRRAVRILPPYALVLAATALAAPLVLFLPDELQEFGYEVGASAVFQANHLYLAEQGYFERGSEARLLLHLWSLAVEEQFYIVAPPAMAAIWLLARRTRNPARVAIAAGAAVAAASLAGCLLLTGVGGSKNYAFYLMPLRAWEFLAGGAAAVLLPLARRLQRPVLEAGGLAGLAAILGSGMLMSSLEPFPSWRAAIPVAGTLAVLVTGMADGRIAAARLLSLRAAVGIGLVSYSWYLWHWPVLTLARMNRFGERELVTDLLLVLFSLALAAATYLLVERPLRDWRRRTRVTWRAGAAIVAGCVMLGAAGLGAYSAGSQSQAMAVDGPGKAPRLRPETNCRIAFMRSLEDCVGASAGYGILVGDSQAEAVTAVLQRFARSRSQALIAAAGGACPPLAVPSGLHIPDAGMAGNCVRIRDALAAGLAGGSLAPSFAILVARWQIYGDPASPYSLVGATGGGGTGDLVAGLRRTIESLQRAGVRRILVVGPSPEFQQSAPRCVALSDRAGIDRDLKCSLPRTLMDARNARATRWLAEAIAPYGFVRLIDPTDVFCDDRFCRPFAGDDVLYIDTNHLSDAGTRAIRDNAIRDFRWAVPAGAANDGGS